MRLEGTLNHMGSKCLHAQYSILPVHMSCMHAGFRCDDYLTTQQDANKVITRGIWGGTVLGKDGRPVPDAKFECKWVDIFCVKNGKIASVDSFFDTAAIQQAFAAAKGASSAA